MSGMFIKKAMYGYGNDQKNMVDITSTIQNIVDKDKGTFAKVSILISPDTFKITDPYPGQTKSFIVEYVSQTGHELLVRGGVDGETVVLTNGHPLEITKAIYGGTNYGVDITEKLSQYCSDAGAPPLVIDHAFNNRFCGADIDPGVRKSLFVEFNYAGGTKNIVAFDGNTVTRTNGKDPQLVVS